MNHTLRMLAFGSVLFSSFGTVIAAPFNSFDPQSMAMGGAGVAVANTGSAPFFNPSLLAVAPEKDHFGMELPIFGIRLYDPADAEDEIDSIQKDYFDPIQNIVASINTNPSNAERDQLLNYTNGLNTKLNALNQAPIAGEAGLAAVVGVPNKNFGIAVTVSGWTSFGGQVNYRDSAYLTGFNSAVATIDFDTPSNNNEADLIAKSDYVSYSTDGSGTVTDIKIIEPSSQMQSTVNVRGVALREIGISVAHEFAVKGATFAVGVTPKLVKAIAYDYVSAIDNADGDDIDNDDYTHEYKNINLDIGLAKNYYNGWRTGFVLKNIIKQQYDTYRRNPVTGLKERTGNIVELKPQARLGVSRQTEMSLVALDIDLTANDPVSYEEKSRYVSLGGELSLLSWAKLRAGYRFNTFNSHRNVASLGFGVSPIGIHFDLALAGNSDEIGAAAQFGFRF